MDTNLIDKLTNLDDEAFTDYVCDNAGIDAPYDVWEALLSEDLVHRTKGVLGGAINDLNVEAAQRKADNPDAHQVWWRQTGLQWRRDLDRRSNQAQRAAREMHLRFNVRNHNIGRAVAAQLAAGIARHRASCAIAGLEPERHDADLWALLDDITVPVGGREATLAELLADGTWRAEP